LKALARRIALAADPLRPSAGRAKPLDDVTSDALCRTTALALELQTSAFARTPHAAPCDEAHSDLRRARTRSIAACLRPPYTLPRTPSFGLMLSLAAEPSSFAITVRNVRTSSAPLSTGARLLSLSRKSCRAALPCAFLARLAAHLEFTGKMRRTDLCNRRSKRAPENRSTPEPAACAAKTASAMSRSVSPDAIRIAAPDHLAAIRPQVDQRLTTLHQLRTTRLRPSH